MHVCILTQEKLGLVNVYFLSTHVTERGKDLLHCLGLRDDASPKKMRSSAKKMFDTPRPLLESFFNFYCPEPIAF